MGLNPGLAVGAQQLTLSATARDIIFFISGDTHVYRRTELSARAVGRHYLLLNTISDRLELFMFGIYSLLSDQPSARADVQPPTVRWRVR